MSLTLHGPSILEEQVHQIGAFRAPRTPPRGPAARVGAGHRARTHRGGRAAHRSGRADRAGYGDMGTRPALKRQLLDRCIRLESRT